MEYCPFPALLRSSYNDTEEFGQATIAVNSNAIDFTSDFVPLLPLGTHAQIDWMLGSTVKETFEGTVYLSSKKLLRIVDINASALTPAREILCMNVRIPAEIHSPSPAAKLINGKKNKTPVTIIYLSNSVIKLRCSSYIAAGQRIALDAEVDFLTLDELVLQVNQRVLLRKDDALLICEPLSVSNENLIALHSYTARLIEQHKKSMRNSAGSIHLFQEEQLFPI